MNDKTIRIKTYGNGRCSVCCFNKMTPEKIEEVKKWRKEHYDEYRKKDSIIDTRVRIIQNINSCEAFEGGYFVTISTDNEELRHDPAQFLKLAKEYIRRHNPDAIFILIPEMYANQATGFHLHGICSEHVDFTDWREAYGSWEFKKPTEEEYIAKLEEARDNYQWIRMYQKMYTQEELEDAYKQYTTAEEEHHDFLTKPQSFSKKWKWQIVDHEENESGLYCEPVLDIEHASKYITKGIAKAKEAFINKYKDADTKPHFYVMYGVRKAEHHTVRLISSSVSDNLFDSCELSKKEDDYYNIQNETELKLKSLVMLYLHGYFSTVGNFVNFKDTFLAILLGKKESEIPELYKDIFGQEALEQFFAYKNQERSAEDFWEEQASKQWFYEADRFQNFYADELSDQIGRYVLYNENDNSNEVVKDLHERLVYNWANISYEFERDIIKAVNDKIKSIRAKIKSYYARQIPKFPKKFVKNTIRSLHTVRNIVSMLQLYCELSNYKEQLNIFYNDLNLVCNDFISYYDVCSYSRFDDWVEPLDEVISCLSDVCAGLNNVEEQSGEGSVDASASAPVSDPALAVFPSPHTPLPVPFPDGKEDKGGLIDRNAQKEAKNATNGVFINQKWRSRASQHEKKRVISAKFGRKKHRPPRYCPLRTEKRIKKCKISRKSERKKE